MHPAEPNLSSQNAPNGVISAVWHSLLWLVVSNAIGMLIAILLLFPALNPFLGEWTYGRWIMVHMNLELYGWVSLPLAAFLLKVFGADREPFAQWCRPVLWVWSAALGAGAYSWLSGHSSGKLFLDWSGYARIFFPLAMLALWLLLALAFVCGSKFATNTTLPARSAKIFALAFLLTVPFLIYLASGPSYYPAINPDTGGPTGASQLESSLIIVAILLMLPYGLTRRTARRSKAVVIAWITLLAEFLLCFALGRADSSHHSPAQFLSLGSLLVWVPLIPLYYAAFSWNENTRRWRIATYLWWAALVVTGWIFFLPGVLDHFKFTDGLVGHSLLAMAGFVTSLLILVLVQLLGEDGRIFTSKRSFYGWNLGVLAYVLLMFIAGWREGGDPAFTIVPTAARDTIYILRLAVGVVMLASSLDWLIEASSLLHKPNKISTIAVEELAA